MGRLKRRLLALLKISERPDPPPGSGASVDVFRASRRYLHLTALAWLPKQLSALAGLFFALSFFGFLDTPFIRAEGWIRFLEFLERFSMEVGGWSVNARMAFNLIEIFAIATFVAQFIFTGAMIKLSWELRWYMVGDESLRIREGLWRLREQTVTLANVQNMNVRQGPIQKLFGIADLEVRTAGGGSSAEAEIKDEMKDLHVARFRGLDDAQGLRDRIRERVNRYRSTGLGDTDDPELHRPGAAMQPSPELGAAAAELRDEVRGLRRAVEAVAAAGRLG